MASLTLTKTTIAASAVTAAGILVAIGLGSLGADEGTTPRQTTRDAAIDTRVEDTGGNPGASDAVAVLPAADGSGATTSEAITEAKKIQAALDELVDVEFLDTPLSDAMEFLSDVHKIPIIIDEQALAEDGIATDEPLNRTLSGLRLDSALNILLKDLRLTYYVDNEVMTITTEVVEDERTETRIYPIGNLVSLGIDLQALEDLLNPDNDIEVHLLGANVVVKQSQSRHRETAELFEMLARAAGQKSK